MEGRLNRHIDRNGSETTYTYNMYHDLVKREHKASGLQEIYGYRKDGSLSYAIGGGMRYDYIYYPDGSLHEKKASGKTLLSFQYDLNGNKIRQSDITGKSTTYTYNALDLLEEVRDNKFSARYDYYSNGTVKSLSVGDKLITHYEYDSDKNLTRQTNYQYDTLNRLVKVQYPKGLEEFTYDKADSRIQRLTEKEEV